MKAYQDLVEKILNEGHEMPDRTGTGRRSLFAQTLEFDMDAGGDLDGKHLRNFPLVTTKETYYQKFVIEMLWFLSGGRNIKPLLFQDVHFWTDWPYEKYKKHCQIHDAEVMPVELFEEKIQGSLEFAAMWGDLGPVYGAQWRGFTSGRGIKGHEQVDQIERLVREVRQMPESRRHLVVAYHPAERDVMALPPCHYAFQVFPHKHESDGREMLSMLLNIRSSDVFLGLPFNIGQYALLLHMIAMQTNRYARKLTVMLADAHLYMNHLDQARELISRKPKAPPVLELNDEVKSIFDYTLSDITVHSYEHHPHIKAPVAV